jgi:hypothetical protein
VVENQQAAKAFTLAEAGIDWAVAQLQKDHSFPGVVDERTYTVTNVSTTGTVLVMITNDGITTTITSWSELPALGQNYPMAKRAIHATVKMGGIMPAEALFKRAITANGRITGNHGASIEIISPLPNLEGTSILSNFSGAGAIQFFRDLYIEDPGYAGIMDGSTIVPNTVPWKYVPPDPVSTLTEEQIKAWRLAAQNEDHYYATSQFWSNNVTLNGIYFIEGDLDVDNNISGSGTLVITGNLTTWNNASFSSDAIALITLGNATFKNNGDILGYIFAGGSILVDSNFGIKGAISCVGDFTCTKNNLTIEYTDFGQGGGSNPAGFSQSNEALQLQSWQEVAPP